MIKIKSNNDKLNSNDYFKPSDLARMFNVHSNTIRLYEKLGYISPAHRNYNNYRLYTPLHILQIKLCRSILGYPFTNKTIRSAGNTVIFKSTQKQWSACLKAATDYTKTIEKEIKLARDTVNYLKCWLYNNHTHENILKTNFLSRKEAADFLDVTTETVRNWERNELIYPCSKGKNGRTLYTAEEFEKIKIVYMLRQSGYSMSAIHKSISLIKNKKFETAINSLEKGSNNELISVGDRWLSELNKLLEASKNIPQIILELEKL